MNCLAEPTQFGGHLKYQAAYTNYQADGAAPIGDDTAVDHSVDFRVKAERRAGDWDFAAHYELLALAGDTLATRRRLSALGFVGGTPSGLPDDRARLFDLTDDVSDGSRHAAVHRLDRFAVGHATPARVLRFGRQAVSWGNGLVFHPLDFINPFSPIAIDKDYKTGDDMLYAQWLLGEQGDVQAILLPRRASATRDIESDQSSYALKLRQRAGAIDFDLLAARHFDANLAAIGVVRNIGGAVWRLDVSATDTGGDTATSLVTNLDYSWTWFGRNTYGYVEYFHSGVGETDRRNYANPNPNLAARIARGELFTLARDYAAVGLQFELSPLVNIYSNLILNINDGSRFWQLRGVYDWQQDLQLMAGMNLPSGDPGDEFGAANDVASFLAPGRSIYARLAYFF